jgi:hypothetical protein
MQAVIVRWGPERSTRWPITGWLSAHATVCAAASPAVVPRSQPSSSWIALKKAPNEPFVPVTTKVTAVQTATIAQPWNRAVRTEGSTLWIVTGCLADRVIKFQTFCSVRTNRRSSG